MKKLKISLSIAVFAIAVSGAMVTKATTQMQTRYIQQASCNPVTTTKTCDEIGSGCFWEGSPSLQLHVRPNPDNPNQCIEPLELED